MAKARTPDPFPHQLDVEFRPGIEVFARATIEKELSDALTEGKCGRVTGGGGMVDGSVSNIGVRVKDMEKGIRVLRVVLQRCKVPTSTMIIEDDGRPRVRHPVYAIRIVDRDDY